MHLPDQQSHSNGNVAAAGDRASLRHPCSREELERTGRWVPGRTRVVRRAAGCQIRGRVLALPSTWGYHVQTTLGWCLLGKGLSPALQLSGGDGWLAEAALRSPSAASGFLGGCCETSGGRHHGMAVTSLTPCTPSASRQCSTSTWRRSPTPSLLGACWGMRLPTCRSVRPRGVPHQPHSAQPVGLLGAHLPPVPREPVVPLGHPEHHPNPASSPGLCGP